MVTSQNSLSRDGHSQGVGDHVDRPASVQADGDDEGANLKRFRWHDGGENYQ